MPWYKMEVSHGPGHMGRDVAYRYQDGDEELTRDGYEDLFYHDIQYYWEWPKFKFEKVDALPEEVRADKIRDYKSSITHAENMLVILGARKRRKGKK